MKIKRVMIVQDQHGNPIYTKDVTLSDAKFREVFGISVNDYVAPYQFRMSSAVKQRYFTAIAEPNDGYYAIVEWQEIPESERERQETVKKFIRFARDAFPPSDTELNQWLKTNCKVEWLFEKHMKEGKFLMAAEELHVMTQCFYGQALGDLNIIRNLNEARKLLALSI